MSNNELFVDINKLPRKLTKEETYELFNNNTLIAREKLIKYNIALVVYEVMSRFKYVNYDKKDLVSIGIIGLIKAIDSYKLSCNTAFSVYAIKCIDNEILIFLRKLKKEQSVISLNDDIFIDKDNNNLKLEDILCNNTSLIEDYERLETIKLIRKMVDELPCRDREILILYFGFYDNRAYTQKE